VRGQSQRRDKRETNRAWLPGDIRGSGSEVVDDGATRPQLAAHRLQLLLGLRQLSGSLLELGTVGRQTQRQGAQYTAIAILGSARGTAAGQRHRPRSLSMQGRLASQGYPALSSARRPIAGRGKRSRSNDPRSLCRMRTPWSCRVVTVRDGCKGAGRVVKGRAIFDCDEDESLTRTWHWRARAPYSPP